MIKVKLVRKFVALKLQMMNHKINLLFILMLISTFLFSQKELSKDTPLPPTESQVKYKHSLGSSFFMLGNFLEESPDYYLLTYGYQFSNEDRVFVEFNTWKYSEPLGTYNKSIEFYPGFVRASGIGVGYQRIHWKGIFSTVQATSFLKQYHDMNDDKTQKGFQLYLQLILGYRFNFFKDRLYIEPAYALKYWPVDTNFPTSFSEIEMGAPKYIIEPSLNFGFKF